MKIDTLKFIGDGTVTLPILGLSSSSPFVLKGADGLSSTEVEVSYEDTAEEGGIRGRRRAVNRQVVARVGLQPAWSAGQTSESLREVLYGLLTTKFEAQVVLQLLQNDSVVGVAKGDVSNIEASIFTKDPECQITLDCDYPYFLAYSTMKQQPVRSTSEGQLLMDISNPGTAYAGFKIEMTLQQTPAGALILSDNATSDSKFMNFGTGWAAGDTLIVDTRPQLRSIKKIKAGATNAVSALNSLSSDSTWLRLHRGTNRLRLNVEAINWYGDAFTHTPAFVGV